MAPQDDGGEEEHAGRDEESNPEADVLLDVDHGNLTGKRSDVDGKVEVEEDTGVGDSRVDDDLLARGKGLDAHASIFVLIGKQGRDVGLEETSTNAKADETNDEGSKSAVLLHDNTGSGRGDENDVGNSGDTNSKVKGPETTHASISNPGTVYKV